ncbi:hypothetical protein [Sporocytophaga myxococcoides]|uniref:hypothetical protein n=1 Tax=Sporocytophaga myxococcoides TaxID=153721 RepID=UPI00048CE312|nr:hypothetical protein [Sporocytophaga myxococcoides]
MKATLKIYLILLISIICSIYPVETLNGCGGWEYYPTDNFYNLVDQEILDAGEYQPFYLNLNNDYYFYDDSVFSGEAANINEWAVYFQNKISKENIKKLVYDYQISDLKAIENFVFKQKKNNLPAEVLSYFSTSQDKDVIPYLLYVRELQPYVTGMDQWEGCAHDNTFATNLLNQGEKMFNGAHSDFIKMRIGYQLTRLAHYSGYYEKAVNYFDKNVAPFSSESSIKYKALGHKAGALKAIDQLSEATYLFSRVFAKCNEKRLEAFRSIVFNGEGFDGALALCKNDDEKVMLYFLNALEDLSSNLNDLTNIYSINPKSKELEVLVMRELKKAENEYVNSGFGNYSDPDLKNFIVSCADEGKVRDVALWNFFAGYFDFLNKDYSGAVSFLNKINSSVTNDTRLLNQVRIVNTVIKIEEKDTIDQAFEGMLLNEFSWLESMKDKDQLPEEFGKAKNYYLVRLSNKYLSNNENIKAELAKSAYYGISLQDNPDENLIDNFIDYWKKEDKSPMDIYLIGMFPYKLSSLYELKGTLALRKADFKSAVYYYNLMDNGKDNTTLSGGDPFEFLINNCIDCGSSENKQYTKLKFAQRMLELENLALTDKKNAASYYFMIGNGLFNTSYYGSSYNLTLYYRSYADGGYSEDVVYTLKNDEGKPDDDAIKAHYASIKERVGKAQNFDCTKAMEYFQKAMSLAKDKELAAQACYMAAKCEESNRYQGNVDIDNGLGKHKFYRILKDKYAGTEFYNEVIDECKYFNNYVKDPI